MLSEAAAARLLASVERDFIGLDQHCVRADGRLGPRHYLDSAASTLMMGLANTATQQFLPHYANPHTSAHDAARSSARALEWAAGTVLDFLGAGTTYTCVFQGSGTTAVSNRLARSLAALRPERPLVLVALTEHHSNDLPHRRHSSVRHIGMHEAGAQAGTVSLEDLERQLAAAGGQVNYVAVTAVSNVTGIVNPLAQMARLAHHYGALLVVDASQAVVHMPIVLGDGAGDDAVDALMFSGHKAYAPGSPGVLVMRKDLLAQSMPEEIGGGAVDSVSCHDFTVKPGFPEREQAGTPNVPGAVTLGTALTVLMAIGMERIHVVETALLRSAIARLAQIPSVRQYGPAPAVGRIGCISFNLDGVPHGLTAAVLNDYHGVAVRNGCFCAHPYVASLLEEEFYQLEGSDEAALEQTLQERRGMVRASFGLYTVEADIDALVAGLEDIVRRGDFFRQAYQAGPDGVFRRLGATALASAGWQPQAALRQRLQQLEVACEAAA